MPMIPTMWKKTQPVFHLFTFITDLKVYESSRFLKQLILWFEDRQMNKGFI